MDARSYRKIGHHLLSHLAMMTFLGAIGLPQEVAAEPLPSHWPQFTAQQSRAKVLSPLGATGETRKRALLVAIEKYGTHYTKNIVGPEWPSLEGTKNDLRLMTRELRRRGFEVAILTDEKATRDAIIQAMGESLYQRLGKKKDNVALFYFAGHGQQVSDVSGDEPDGYDEAIVTYDNNGVGGQKGRLLDDDLGTMLRFLAERAGNVVVIMDSCHSGGATRGNQGPPAGLRPRGGHAPLGPPKCGTLCRPDTAGLESEPTPKNLVFLSATQSHQLAYEAPSLGPHGAFTYYFTQALNRLPANTTYAGLMGQVRASMSHFKSIQWPSLEGDGRRVVLDSRRGEEVEGFWVRKAPKSEEFFIVDSSPASGVLVGSVLEVRPLDGPPRQRGVRLRVEEFVAGEMRARALDQGITALRALEPIIQGGGIGRVISAPRGLGALELDATDAPASILRVLEKYPNLVKLSGPDSAFEIVRNAQGAFSIHGAGGVPLPLPVCADKPMVTTVEQHTPGAAQAILNALQYEQRRRRLLAFGGRGRPRGIQARFEVQADRHPFDGARKVTKNALFSGGNGSVRISNTGTVPFYPYLVEVSNDGTVNVLYPNVAEHEVSQAIQPGKTSPTGSILITAGVLPGKQQYVLITSKSPIDDIAQLAFVPMPVGQCTHHPAGFRVGRSRTTHEAPWSLFTQTVTVVDPD